MRDLTFGTIIVVKSRLGVVSRLGRDDSGKTGGTALALLMIMTINAVFNHAGWEAYSDKWGKGWWGKHIITASHHNLHHTKFKGNYGLYFRF